MVEQTFFEYEDVKVTNSRFISGGQTYAMSNVTSVKAFEKQPKKFWGVILLIFGLLMAINTPAFGIILAACSAFYLYKQKTEYHIMLATSAGETSALKTYQKDYLQKVVAALNDAIIHRG